MIEFSILLFMSSLMIHIAFKTEVGKQIIDGFKTKKEDLEVDWDVLHKAERELREKH